MWRPGALGPIDMTPGYYLVPCPPQNFFYFAFKMVYFGAFWTDLLTMRTTYDTTTTAAVGLGF